MYKNELHKNSVISKHILKNNNIKKLFFYKSILVKFIQQILVIIFIFLLVK